MAAIATNNIIDINQYEMPCDPITLDPYQKPTRLLKCGHTMNEHSLLQMINVGNNICPVCQVPFQMNTDVKTYPRNYALEHDIEYRRNMEIQLRNKFATDLNESKIKGKKEKLLLLKYLSDKYFQCLYEIAELYSEIADYENTIITYNTILELTKNNKEFNNIMIDTIIKCSEALIANSKYDQALESLLSIQEKVDQMNEDNNNSKADLCFNLGKALFSKDKYKEALTYFDAALNEYMKTGRAEINQQKIASCTWWSGQLSLQLGNYEEALKLHSKSLNARLKLFNQEHPDVGRSYNSVAEAKHYLGKHEEALELHELALNIFKNKYGFEHPEVAETFELTGVTYIGMEEIEDRAIPYLMESVKIRKKTQGETHSALATTYNNIGQAYFKAGKLEHTVKYFELSSDILISNFGSNNTKVAISKSNIGYVYYAQKNFVKSHECLKEAYEIMCEELGKENPQATKILNDMNNVATKL